MEKLGIEEISNGWLITSPDGKTYRERLVDAANELKVEVDALLKTLKETHPEPPATKTTH